MSSSVSVIVPSYRRPQLLERCLTALGRQTLAPLETIAVLRRSDSESVMVANAHASDTLVVLETDASGVLAAMRLGVAHSTGDIVAFTDDDAEPNSGWLAGLVAMFDEPDVGAAGGRDAIRDASSPRQADVGRLTLYGKLVGNHHLGVGPPRDVDTLKGVNMGLRAECLALPRHGVLRGDGAEVHFEVMCSRWARKHGWRVVYDPSIEVAHLGAPRIGLDQRTRPSYEAIRDAAHNFLVATAGLDRRRLPRQALYAIGLGSRETPGIGRAGLAIARRERDVLRRVAPSLTGSFQALMRFVRSPTDLSMVTCAELRAGRLEKGLPT